MKWWNSNIGVCATHATVFAQLILDGYRHTAYYICLGIIKYLHCVVCMFFFRVTDSFSVLFLNAVATFFLLLTAVAERSTAFTCSCCKFATRITRSSRALRPATSVPRWATTQLTRVLTGSNFCFLCCLSPWHIIVACNVLTIALLGYLRLKNVRSPREHILSKRQHVTADGRYA